MSLPPLRICVLRPTAKVHSASLPLALPVTTSASAEDDLTVPLASRAAGFFISAAGFSAALGAVGVVWPCARALPVIPAPKATAISIATSLFTAFSSGDVGGFYVVRFQPTCCWDLFLSTHKINQKS